MKSLRFGHSQVPLLYFLPGRGRGPRGHEGQGVEKRGKS